jgi:cytochrome P450
MMPQNFHPDRWLPQSEQKDDIRANKSAVNSFSWGPHACIAKTFAYQEMHYVLSRLVLSVDFVPANDFDPQAFRNGITNMRTTMLERPLMAHMKKRREVWL